MAYAQAIPQLRDKRSIAGQISAIEIVVFPATRRRGDLTNKAESVMDLLVDCKVIEDDNWFSVPRVNLIFGGVDRTNPRAEVTIYES